MGLNCHIDSSRPKEVPTEILGIVELSIHKAVKFNDAFSSKHCPPQSILSLRSARVAMATLYLAAVLLLSLSGLGSAFSFPPLTGRVVDQAGIMNAQSRSELEAKLKNLENKSGIQLVVATVKSLEGSDIETYANQLFRNWKLGEAKKNNGVLLLVAPNEHKVRIGASQRGIPHCLLSIERITEEHHGPLYVVSIRIYSSTGLVAPTHNGVGQSGGPSIVSRGSAC